jgi:para-aminobenzoate synthetase/4-amino-4-deoxychorismate lyase
MKPNCVYLETCLPDAVNQSSYLFQNPREICIADTIKDITDLFGKIEQALQEGYWCAGYFSYEAGEAFEKIGSSKKSDTPLAWFGIYDEPCVFSPGHSLKKKSGSFKIDKLKLAVSLSDYSKKLSKIKEYIAAGDVYQINFTSSYQFDFSGSPEALFKDLCAAQKVNYAAFIQTEQETILSISPELFFRREGEDIITQPMKGTAQPGREAQLGADEKNRAELLMITDLLRNDLGRICRFGTITVDRLFKVEKYKTVSQMISIIRGRLRQEVNYYDIFKALFPSGSVTGAPKIRARQIIDELETSPRGVYTGAIGYISPRQKAVFNVPIRTLTIRETKGSMGSGSGIVWDSKVREEYEEIELKARFLQEQHAPFSLLETIKYDQDYQLLDLHLKRILAAAKQFKFSITRNQLLAALEQNRDNFEQRFIYKVRLLAAKGGLIEIENSPIKKPEQKIQPAVAFADQPVNSDDKFLYHKTTNRKLYNQYHTRADKNHLADYLFCNERGEVTEGSISNIFIRVGEKYYTPPLKCGLLNGVYRQYFLQYSDHAYEKVLTMEDVRNADAIYLCNAIRGMTEVTLKK